MSEFPTCPTHQVLKPCPHCEPSKYLPAVEPTIKVCGDVKGGEKIEKCHCGAYREEGRWHGYTRRVY